MATATARSTQAHRTIGATLTLCEDIRREENRLEKAAIALDTPSTVLDSIKDSLAFLNQQRLRLDREMDQHIDADPTLKQNDALLQSIKGVDPRVAQRMLARGKSKMAGIGAAMRKRVPLCLGVIHSQRPYDPSYKTPAKT